MSNLPATQAPATPQRVQDIDGLEDVEARDIAMPIIKIQHTDTEEGYPVFADPTGTSLDKKIEVVVLGMVKQRVMWDPKRRQVGDEKVYPQCRSRDFHTGRPDQENFPWGRTPFTPGTEMLSCDECPLKEWGTGADDKRPACGEQHVLVVKRRVTDEYGEEDLLPGIVTFQSTGLKPSGRYIGLFASEKKAPYTSWTEIELEKKRQGNVSYGVPKFRRVGNTTPDVRDECSIQWPGMRQFLREWRSNDSDSSSNGTGTTDTTTTTPSDNVNRGPAQTGNAPADDNATAAPQAAAAAPQADDDDQPQPVQRRGRAAPAATPAAAPAAPAAAPAAAGPKPDDDLPF